MRHSILLALCLSACGMPFKYQVFDLAPQHNDVVWVYRDGALHRCWQHASGPVCAEALFLSAAELRAMMNQHSEAGAALANPPPELPRSSQKAPPPKPAAESARQYPDWRPQSSKTPEQDYEETLKRSKASKAAE